MIDIWVFNIKFFQFFLYFQIFLKCRDKRKQQNITFNILEENYKPRILCTAELSIKLLIKLFSALQGIMCFFAYPESLRTPSLSYQWGRVILPLNIRGGQVTQVWPTKLTSCLGHSDCSDMNQARSVKRLPRVFYWNCQ